LKGSKGGAEWMNNKVGGGVKGKSKSTGAGSRGEIRW